MSTSLKELAADLAALNDRNGDALAATSCPACANRDYGLERNARYLLDELSENAGFRAAPGVIVCTCRRKGTPAS